MQTLVEPVGHRPRVGDGDGAANGSQPVAVCAGVYAWGRGPATASTTTERQQELSWRVAAAGCRVGPKLWALRVGVGGLDGPAPALIGSPRAPPSLPAPAVLSAAPTTAVSGLLQDGGGQ